MNDPELIEYAVYHWTFGGDHNLPGLNHDGTIDADFFDRYPINASYEDFAEQFTQLQGDPILSDENSLLLCSGGVDSSLLACFRKENLRHTQQQFLHTSYVEHDNNDLYKFNNVLLHCASSSFISSVDANAYISGIDLLSQNNFFQNTYGPTLAFALDSADTKSFSSLVTGSGPDELFYGMEKYSWDVFEKLSELPTPEALERLDPRYNEEAYGRVFNNAGKELFFEVKRKRLRLYQNIAEVGLPIFDSQRLLAYATVTAQHMQLFNSIAQFFSLKHQAPYLNDELVRLALSTPLADLVELGVDKRVEIGKKYLKKYLSSYMSDDHVYGRKIGFHAPTTKYVYETGQRFLLENIDFIPDWLDKDLTLQELKKRYEENSNNNDYFLYSLLNILKHNMRNRDAS